MPHKILIAANAGSFARNYLVHSIGIDGAAVLEYIESIPGWTDGTSEAAEMPVLLSAGLTATMALVKDVHAAVVTRGQRDVCTEHIVAAMLLYPRGLGRAAIEVGCDRMPTTAFLTELGIETESFRQQARATRAASLADGQAWAMGPAGVHADGEAAVSVWMQPPLIQEDFEQMRGPTAESNWLIPGATITGAHPEYHDYYNDPVGTLTAQNIVETAGVDTFVCLVEDEPAYVVPDLVTPEGKPVRWLWFPINDFDIEDDATTLAFVEELVRQVRRGHKLYIHCYSGRGRTGTIAIPLLLAIYPELNYAEALRLINEYKRFGRTGSTRGGHMPEMPQQRSQVRSGVSMYKRGGSRPKNL